MNYSPLYKQNQKIGNAGEAYAEQFLQTKGLLVIARNVHIGRLEIDLIAQDGDTVVFVEVKTRHSLEFGDPLSGITPQKFYRMQKAAMSYMQKEKVKNYRFDIIGVTVRENATLLAINYIKDIC